MVSQHFERIAPHDDEAELAPVLDGAASVAIGAILGEYPCAVTAIDDEQRGERLVAFARGADAVLKMVATTLGRSAEPFALFGIDGALILVSVAVATIGLVIGIALFGFFRRSGRRRTVEAITASSGATRFLYRASLNKWWFDDLNHLLFMVIGGRVANALWWFDRTVVDGTVNAVGRITVDAGGGLRRIQTGHVQNYALGIAIGLIIMAGSYLVIASR